MTNAADNDNGGVESFSGEYKKFIQGEFGLAATYWGFGVAVAAIFRVVNWFVPHRIKWLFLIACIAYGVVLLIALVRAAEKYNGKKIWGYLAMLLVMLGILSDLKAFSQLLN